MLPEDSRSEHRPRERRYENDHRKDRSHGDDDAARATGRRRSRDRHRKRSRSPHSRRPSRDSEPRRRDRSKDALPRRKRDQEDEDHAATRRHRERRRSPGETERGRDSPRDGDRTSRGLRGEHAPIKRSGPLPSQDDSFAMVKSGEDPDQAKPKEKPNFGTTGVLAAASNSVTQADGTTITLKYHEPPEARKPPPKDQWKLFIFKGADIVDTIELSLRSCWLVGRDIAIADLPAEHPSISKQHAVIQFRYTEKRNEYGDKTGRVKPYLIDLESANGTTLNNEKVAESRYLELRDKDMIQFGQSTREYVLMLAPRD